MFAAAINQNIAFNASFAQARLNGMMNAPAAARSNNTFSRSNVKADRLAKPESFKAYRKDRQAVAGKSFRRQQAKADLLQNMAARGMDSKRAQQIEETFSQLLDLLR